jgi:branched-chain amino acid transport system substrate-binding protein
LLAFGTCQAASQSDSAKPGAISDDVVKVAVLTDMAGPNSDLAGPGSVEAARMAVADFGGKVLGKRIELIYGDHQNKTDVASQTVRAWIDTEGVDMIVDANNSAVALAVAKIATEKKRIFIAGGAATTRLTNEDCSPYVVHYVYDTYPRGRAHDARHVSDADKEAFRVQISLGLLHR